MYLRSLLSEPLLRRYARHRPCHLLLQSKRPNTTSWVRFLVGANGNALYVFTRDGPKKTNSSGRCAENWPPHVTVGEPTAGEGITASSLRTTTREDGSTQVTYNGHPLYCFANDEKPGNTNGQGLGGSWFVLSPAGDPITTAN